jgi:hypothetical protein
MSAYAEFGYRESVRAPWWFQLALLLSALGAALGALIAATDGGTRLLERVVGTLALLAAAALLASVGRMFTTLDISVTPRRVRFGFGPFATTLRSGELTAARVERYPWWRFGGWGLRRSIVRWGDRAFTVPFVSDAVALEVADGRRYHVSTRRPERFAAAAAALAAASPVSGGSL